MKIQQIICRNFMEDWYCFAIGGETKRLYSFTSSFTKFKLEIS